MVEVRAEAGRIAPLNLDCGLAAPRQQTSPQRAGPASTSLGSKRNGPWSGRCTPRSWPRPIDSVPGPAPSATTASSWSRSRGSSFAKAGKKIWVFVLNTSTAARRLWRHRSPSAESGWSAESMPSARRARAIWSWSSRITRSGASTMPDERATLLSILGRHDNMVGYFAGHTHDSQLRVVHPPGGHRFWEVVAPSTLVFPQQARMVQVKLLEPVQPATPGRESNLAYFDVDSVLPHRPRRDRGAARTRHGGRQARPMPAEPGVL